MKNLHNIQKNIIPFEFQAWAEFIPHQIFTYRHSTRWMYIGERPINEAVRYEPDSYSSIKFKRILKEYRDGTRKGNPPNLKVV